MIGTAVSNGMKNKSYLLNDSEVIYAIFDYFSFFSVNVNAFPEPVMSATCCFISVVAVNEAACDSLVKELMEQFLFITKVDYAGEMGKWS